MCSPNLLHSNSSFLLQKWFSPSMSLSRLILWSCMFTTNCFIISALTFSLQGLDLFRRRCSGSRAKLPHSSCSFKLLLSCMSTSFFVAHILTFLQDCGAGGWLGNDSTG